LLTPQRQLPTLFVRAKLSYNAFQFHSLSTIFKRYLVFLLMRYWQKWISTSLLTRVETIRSCYLGRLLSSLDYRLSQLLTRTHFDRWSKVHISMKRILVLKNNGARYSKMDIWKRWRHIYIIIKLWNRSSILLILESKRNLQSQALSKWKAIFVGVRLLRIRMGHCDCVYRLLKKTHCQCSFDKHLLNRLHKLRAEVDKIALNLFEINPTTKAEGLSARTSSTWKQAYTAHATS
jgi:hypothetical protein